jgi:hypothetical protein
LRGFSFIRNFHSELCALASRRCFIVSQTQKLLGGLTTLRMGDSLIMERKKTSTPARVCKNAAN